MILICVKQHLSNIEAQFMKKVGNAEAEWKKSVAYKKSCFSLERKTQVITFDIRT